MNVSVGTPISRYVPNSRVARVRGVMGLKAMSVTTSNPKTDPATNMRPTFLSPNRIISRDALSDGPLWSLTDNFLVEYESRRPQAAQTPRAMTDSACCPDQATAPGSPADGIRPPPHP